MSEKKVIKMKMEPKHLFRSIAGFKYQLHEAIGDLADNAVDADCKRIFIEISKNGIVIADNGSGMDFDTLANAITPWASAEESGYRKGKLGVYGIGLKSAAFSLGRVLEIHTRSKNGEFYHIALDQKDLIGRSTDEFPYSNSETALFKRFNLKTGTVIQIKDVNTRKVTQPAIDKLRNQIGLMFFRKIEKEDLRILVNDEKVEPLNPLLPDLAKGSPKNFYHSYGTKIVKFKRENGNYAEFKIRAVHLGRASFWSNGDRTKYRFFLRKTVTKDNEFSSGLLKLDEQGIYLMRNDRLITLGGWFGIIRTTTLLHHDVCLRIVIEYDSKDDDLIGVDHTKTVPDFIDDLKNKLRDESLAALSHDSELRFRAEHAAIDAEQQKIADRELKAKPLASAKWAKTSAKPPGKGPSASHFPAPPKNEDDEKDLQTAAKGKQEWFEMRSSLPYNALWAGEKNKDDEILLFLNEKHPGYSALYLEKNPNKLRQNLNYLFYNMAIFEVDADEFVKDLKPSEKEILKKAFKEFRKFVSRRLAEVDDEEK